MTRYVPRAIAAHLANPAGARRRVQLRLALALLGIGVTAVVVGAVSEPHGYWPMVIAGSLGALVAIAELVSRYRDDPVGAVLSIPAVLYVVVNAAAAMAALLLIHVFGWDFGASATSVTVTQVLVAGFGAAALFRTSLFNVTIGDQVIGIGPSAVLNVLLGAADRSVDRQRAAIRAANAEEIMDGFPFDAGAEALIRYCVATMQNLTAAEAKAVEDTLSALRDQKNATMPEPIKAYILGLALIGLVGDSVLRRAAHQLREILPTPATAGLTDNVRSTTNVAESILTWLRDTNRPIPLQQLRKELALPLEVSRVIGNLRDQSLVTLSGFPGSEEIRIAGT